MVLSRPEHSLYVALGGIGQEWIRTTEGVSQRIYSPPRLATSVPTRILRLESGERSRFNRMQSLTFSVHQKVLMIHMSRGEYGVSRPALCDLGFLDEGMEHSIAL